MIKIPTTNQPTYIQVKQNVACLMNTEWNTIKIKPHSAITADAIIQQCWSYHEKRDKQSSTVSKKENTQKNIDFNLFSGLHLKRGFREGLRFSGITWWRFGGSLITFYAALQQQKNFI